MVTINPEISIRLKKLREDQNWSQSRLARELNKYLKDINLDGRNGIEQISQLENGKKNLSTYFAEGYSNVFNVSFDYLYCRSCRYNNDIRLDDLGLSQESLAILDIWNKIKPTKLYDKPGFYDLKKLDDILKIAYKEWIENPSTYSIFAHIGMVLDYDFQDTEVEMKNNISFILGQEQILMAMADIMKNKVLSYRDTQVKQ